jgi:hypothetical protein
VTAPWVTYADLPAPLPTLPGGEDEWAQVIALASEVLWALSGRRFGGPRTRTVQIVAPVAGRDTPPGWSTSWGPVHPALVDGELVNCTCHEGALLVRLPSDAVTAVDEVRVRGAARDPATYALTGSYLHDLTGAGWPTCPPGFSVTYRAGTGPPAGGRTAAGLLARELGRARAGDPACGLPANVTSATRQGVTQTFLTAADLTARGQTGVVPVDTWLATVNPGRLARRARAWSPDTHPRTVRRTP